MASDKPNLRDILQINGSKIFKSIKVIQVEERLELFQLERGK